MIRTIGFAAALFLLSGCSRPALHVINVPPPIFPSGWNTADDEQDGIRLGIPPGWHEGVDTVLGGIGLANGIAQDSSQQSPAPNSPAAALQSQMQADDAAQQKEGLAELREKGTVINVVDASKPIPGEDRTRFYVKKIDHSGDWSLEAARDDEIEFYRGWGADPPRRIKLPIGNAYKFSSDHKTRAGDEVTRLSYVVVDGKETYCLCFVSTNNPQAFATIGDQVAQSWRISPK